MNKSSIGLLIASCLVGLAVLLGIRANYSVLGMMEYVGNFHPTTIHFPIVLILLAGLLELAAMVRYRTSLRSAARFCIMGGALTAIMSAILGQGAALAAGFDGRMGGALGSAFKAHRLLGGSTALLASAAAIMSAFLHPDRVALRRGYRITLLACALMVGAAGFFGGSLVYGINHYSTLSESPQNGASASSGAPPATTATTGVPEVHWAPMRFPLGTNTPSETCGACHKEIYQEFSSGAGSDLHYRKTTLSNNPGQALGLPANTGSGSTAHAFAGIDQWPVHAREQEKEEKSCNVCHFPQPFRIPGRDIQDVPKPEGRPADQQTAGITCASCHLTPDHVIRGPYDVAAPHPTVKDTSMQASNMCAYCHSLGKRVVGKQTQTYLEWREDFSNPGLGTQQCQDCHMPRTVRKLVKSSKVSERAVGRHLWTGGHSFQRLQSALNLAVAQPDKAKAQLEFRVANVGAGHSVPTGSNRRAVYLITEVFDKNGNSIASHRWMFAPWYGDRPDDKAYLEADKSRKDAVAALQADAQGPHETSIRAGEKRLLKWAPMLPKGVFTVQTRLIYDLNRYNDSNFTEDQSELARHALQIEIR